MNSKQTFVHFPTRMVSKDDGAMLEAIVFRLDVEGEPYERRSARDLPSADYAGWKCIGVKSGKPVVIGDVVLLAAFDVGAHIKASDDLMWLPAMRLVASTETWTSSPCVFFPSVRFVSPLAVGMFTSRVPHNKLSWPFDLLFKDSIRFLGERHGPSIANTSHTAARSGGWNQQIRNPVGTDARFGIPTIVNIGVSIDTYRLPLLRLNIPSP